MKFRLFCFETQKPKVKSKMLPRQESNIIKGRLVPTNYAD